MKRKVCIMIKFTNKDIDKAIEDASTTGQGWIVFDEEAHITPELIESLRKERNKMYQNRITWTTKIYMVEQLHPERCFGAVRATTEENAVAEAMRHFHWCRDWHHSETIQGMVDKYNIRYHMTHDSNIDPSSAAVEYRADYKGEVKRFIVSVPKENEDWYRLFIEGSFGLVFMDFSIGKNWAKALSAYLRKSLSKEKTFELHAERHDNDYDTWKKYSVVYFPAIDKPMTHSATWWVEKME